jgi:phosphoglycerol transferase MdoB-like AlkP superfamily enzyme
MSESVVLPSRWLQHVCIASGLGSAGLAIYFWVLGARTSSGLAGPWYWMTAFLFSVLAVGAIIFWSLAVLTRRRRPALAEVATVAGCICGLLPLSLTVAFALLEAFG